MILEHTGISFGEEDYIEDVIKTGKLVLVTMKYEIINGKMTENPSN